MICQNYNHPGIVMWSLYNEVNNDSPADPLPLMRELNELAHQEDPTRPTTGAGSNNTIDKLPGPDAFA